MLPFEDDLLLELFELKEQNLYRTRWLKNKNLSVLCSNNYLNLSNHPRVKEASIKAVERFGTSSGASQLVSGYTELHKRLEDFLTSIKGVEGCLNLGSGYLANVGVISAFFRKGDVVFSDRLNHASIIDGIRLSGADKFVYPHRDVKTLENLLREHRNKYNRCGIITDSVFSMDGDIAPLGELNRLAKTYNCALLVDDAHATGTIGLSSLEFFRINPEGHLVQIGTFSKALGSYGAYVCGSKAVIEYLINRARSLIFSTALPPGVVAASLEALKVLTEKPQLILELQKRSTYLKKLLREEGFDLGLSEDITPIVPIMVYDEEKALKVRDCLLQKGFFVQAIRYPTVERGKARLRLTITLEYPLEVYLKFVETLKSCVKI